MKRELKAIPLPTASIKSRGSRVRPYEEGTERHAHQRHRDRLCEAEFVPMKRELKVRPKSSSHDDGPDEAEFVPMKRELKAATFGMIGVIEK